MLPNTPTTQPQQLTQQQKQQGVNPERQQQPPYIPRIAIIGAGPAGLCLGRILQLHNHDDRFDIVIYEADISASARKQGGSLDLHVSTGQRALRHAQLYDEFTKHIQIGADKLMIRHATDGTILYQDPGNNRRPEIERNDLRSILLQSLQTNTIRWGMKLRKVQESSMAITSSSSSQDEPTGRRRIELLFENMNKENNGNSSNNNEMIVETCDVVIGADGAWSKVREVLTDSKPQYTGLSFWDIETSKKDKNHRTDDNGTIFALDHHNYVMMAHLNDQTIHTYVGCRCEKGKLPSLSQLIHGWHNDIIQLTKCNKDDRDTDSTASQTICEREIYALPIGIQWKRPYCKDIYGQNHWTYHVGLIGDAAHVMSPMAGEGVNVALADATDLAYSIIKNRTIVEFEQRYLFRRAKRMALESDRNLQLFFPPNNKKDVTRTTTKTTTILHPAEIVTKKMRDLMSIRSVIIETYYTIMDWFIDFLWMVGWLRVSYK